MDTEQLKLLFTIFLRNVEEIFERNEKKFTNCYLDELKNDSSFSDIIDFSVRIANNSDKSEKSELDINSALYSVFNSLNENNGNVAFEKPKYSEICDNLNKILPDCELSSEYINPILAGFQDYSTEIPTSAPSGKTTDISLFDTLKITAMLSVCIKKYLDNENISDYKTEISKPDFSNRPIFLMYSFDFSGIQDFIYSISGSSAGKYLRARSFYLEILTEHIIDEILECCGLSRCNLIYGAGCHGYLMLPNFPEILEKIAQKQAEIKDWFSQQFGTKLFVGFAFTECSANDLMNVSADKNIKNPYPEIYRRLSKQLSNIKLNRYTAEEIAKLNSKDIAESTRECVECKTSENLNENNYCPLCQALKDISLDVVKDDVCFKVAKQGEIPLPCNSYLSVYRGEDKLVELKSKSAKRFYSKNSSAMVDGKINFANNILIGDYTYSKDFSGFFENAEGINRIGVLRADVDKLGLTFMNGFVNNGSYKNLTLARTATLSRQLSFFFKQKINSLIDGKKANIIYSGGDDVFIVGFWNDIIEISLILQCEFKKFTQNTLQISAGIGLYGAKFPVKRFAEETGKLESTSKNNGRNRVTLFSSEFCYEWDVFRKNILEEKYKCIKDFFNEEDKSYENESENARGTAFLYRILELIRNAENKINLARLAYMLTRLEPHQEERKLQYKKFSESVMKWATDKTTRKELELAIIIYVYEKRKRS
jgi:CRISPR-associated protein Csm1